MSILRKVCAKSESTFDQRVSSRKPFGLPTNFFGAEMETPAKPIKLYSSGKITWVSLDQIATNQDWVDKWKVLVAAATDGNENYPLPIWDQRGPFVSGPTEACSETYLVASLAEDAVEAERHSRLHAHQTLSVPRVAPRRSPNITRRTTSRLFPIYPMDRSWTDEALYERYGITDGRSGVHRHDD